MYELSGLHLTDQIAREALIEGLTHIDVDELQAAIETLRHDKQSRFLPLLENSMCNPLWADNTDTCSVIEVLERCVLRYVSSEFTYSFSHREVSCAAKMRAPLTPTAIRETCLVMNFLALCCNAVPFPGCGASASVLLSTVAIYALRLETSCLSCHFLTAVSSLGSGRGDIPPNKSVSMGLDKLTWEVALSCPRSDILMACKYLSKSLGL
jgi:hypothetical protein